MKNEKTSLTNEKSYPVKSTTDMAVDRTLMAADRSLMAWVRTGLSLISFGFTIYKFLQYSREQLLTTAKDFGNISSPKVIGLFLIGMGLLSLIFGSIEYVQITSKLKKQYQTKHLRYALLMSAIIMMFGLILFLGILFRFKGIS